MTKNEIINDRKMQLVCMENGKVFTDIFGKNVQASQLRTILFYNSHRWVGSKTKNASLDSLFFYCVKQGRVEIPEDYETCTKCNGTGNVGHIQHSGICYKCNGFGYKKIN